MELSLRSLHFDRFPSSLKHLKLTASHIRYDTELPVGIETIEIDLPADKPEDLIFWLNNQDLSNCKIINIDYSGF